MQPNKPVVLVVDDDPVNLDILVQTLEQDYFLIIAKNGKRALDLAFSHHPDLILLDILMPEMDGFEVCQRLKADKETEGIPVIFLSVMESPGQKHRGFEVGGVDYVTKPFHADEVLARVLHPHHQQAPPGGTRKATTCSSGWSCTRKAASLKP